MSENPSGTNYDDEPQLGNPDMDQGSSKFPNPYVGPRPLNRNESQKLGGRDKEIDQLLDLLVAERIVLLHAPSGAGKTSLIDAGLRSRLVEEEDFWVSDMLSVNRPPNDPAILDQGDGVNRFMLSLLISLEKAKEDQPDEALLSHEELATLTLSEYLEEHLTKPAQDKDIVLIFDQFEEILTVDPYDIKAKRSFFDQVGKALKKRTRWALFAARADYLYGFERYERAVPTRFSNTFGLRLLGHDAAVDAIQKPAATVHMSGSMAEEPGCVGCIRFEEDAAEHVVTNLMQGTPYVEPVLLQVVCRDLWNQLSETDRLEDGDINLDDAQEMTDVDVALKVYYANSLVRVARKLSGQNRDNGRSPDTAPAGDDTTDPSRETDLQERKIREWVGEELIKNGIRTQVQVNANDAVAGIAEELEGVYLVRKDERRGSFWYELAHDRLLRPIQEDNKRWFDSKLAKLQKRAKLWKVSKEEDFLLENSEGDLDEALAWAAEHQAELEENERKFLDASVKADKVRSEQEQTRQALDEAKSRELEAAKEAAESAEREVESARKFKFIAAAAGLLLFLASVLLFWALAAGLLAFSLSSKSRLDLDIVNRNDNCEAEADEQERLSGDGDCHRAVRLATMNSWNLLSSLREKAIVQRLTDAEQISRACMNGLLYESEEWEASFEVACVKAVELASEKVEDLDVLNDLCSFALDREVEAADDLLLDACSLAPVSAAQIVDDLELDQINLACQNGLSAGLSIPELGNDDAYKENVRAACLKAVDIAQDAPALAQVNLACQNALSAELKVESGGESEERYLPEVEAACLNATILSSDSTDLLQVNLACKNALSAVPSSADDKQACRTAIDLVARPRGELELAQVNLACENGLDAGLTAGEVLSACRRADLEAQSSANLVQVYKTLGGGWEIRENKDPVELLPAAVKDQMLERTKDWQGVLE